MAAQLGLLAERLKAVGYEVAVYSFPRYQAGSSHFIKEYLNGGYGPSDEISPYTATLFYALDRYEASKAINRDLSDGKIVLANNYAGANMALQGAKFGDPVEQRGFFVWNDNLEYELLKLPRPDTNMFLRVPAAVSRELVEKSDGASSVEQLKKSVTTYDLLCRLFPKDFKAIDCVKSGQLLNIPDISNLIWDKIKPILPADKPKAGRSTVVTLGGAAPSTSELPKESAPDKLRMPFKSSSLLLRLEIEKASPGSTGPKDGPWSDAGYEFYTPRELPKELKADYRDIISGLADKQSRLVEKLIDYIEKRPAAKRPNLSVSYLAAPVTPLGAIAPFEVALDKSSVLPLVQRLLEAALPEAQWAAKQLYLTARQVWPADFKQPLETSDDVTPIGSIIARLAQERLSSSNADQPVKLLEAVPRQEFDLLAETIYPFSNLPLDEITEEVAEWPYQQKYDNLRRAASQPDVLSKVHYKMDVISDQISMISLAQAAGLKHLQAQPVSPRYGFEVPQIFEDANLDDLYNDCFDGSLRLYSLLQAAGQEEAAGYAALMGHKVRWQLNASAAGFYAAYKADDSPKKLLSAVIRTAAEAHPLLWDMLVEPADAKKDVSRPAVQTRVKPAQRHRGGKPKKS